MTLPRGFNCGTCSRWHGFSAYVYAHTREVLDHECETCGARHEIVLLHATQKRKGRDKLAEWGRMELGEMRTRDGRFRIEKVGSGRYSLQDGGRLVAQRGKLSELKHDVEVILRSEIVTEDPGK